MHLRYLTITEDELEQLRAQLDAVLDIYRGKDASGGFIDTVQYTRAQTCPDLAAEADFEDYIENYEQTSSDLVFDYDGFGSVRVRVSLINGSVWIRNAVPEEIIDHVFRAVLRVKG